MYAHLFRSCLLGLLVLFSGVTQAANCPNGTMSVSEWNHMFDGTSMDISGCLIRVKEPLSEPAPDDQQGTIIPKADTPIPDTPAGWTAPVPPATQPTPPSTTSASYTWDAPASICKGLSSYTDAAECQLTFYPGISISTYTVVSTTGGQPSLYSVRLSDGLVFQVSRNLFCPSGYTWNGTVCNMTNPATVMKPSDSKCNIIRSGNTFSGDPKDPDCGSPFYTAGKIEISGNTVKVKTDPSLTVKANTDGSTTISTTTINNTNNTTTISTANFNNAGIQTGRKTETFNGVGDSQNQVSNDEPFDVSSLNKEATQSAIKGVLDSIDDKLEAPTDTTLQTQKDEFNTAADAHRAKIEEIGTNGLDSHGISWSWFPTIPSATCSPVSYGVTDHMFTWDICPTVEKVRDISGFILYIITAMGLFSILTGRKES